MGNFNQEIEYDVVIKIVIVSLGYRVEVVMNYLSGVGRFFFLGYFCSVVLGGFLFVGGQGCFMCGWGYMVDIWILQLEVVIV